VKPTPRAEEKERELRAEEKKKDRDKKREASIQWRSLRKRKRKRMLKRKSEQMRNSESKHTTGKRSRMHLVGSLNIQRRCIDKVSGRESASRREAASR
jgi:hypothetical protein